MTEDDKARGAAITQTAGVLRDRVGAERQEFGPAHSAAIMREAPPSVGLAILRKTMTSNARTFAGSGQFEYQQTKTGTELPFGSCAMCRAELSSVRMCDFYAGTFEHLIQVLVSATVHVVAVECIAHGGRCCRFALQGMT